MAENKHTSEELRQWQALPLSIKVRMTKRRIRDWVNEYGVEGVSVSFSGGKDSTVLLDLVRQEFPDVPAVFFDTGLEYPEIRDYVKGFWNVKWLKPKMTFRQVVEKYGYPFISKEVSQSVYEIRNAIEKGIDYETHYRWKELNGTTINPKTGGPSTYNYSKYKFLIDAPFRVTHKCCNVMKKNLSDRWVKETGRNPIIATMAQESRLRHSLWIRKGCNMYDAKHPKSTPMAFWTENDVLQYAKENGIKFCSVYGDIVEDGELPGQMTWSEYAGFDTGVPKYKTTGLNRTGCMFCGFGCHLEKPGEGRFERMKITHPKQYNYIMKPWDQGGLGYKEVIDWINEHGNLNIRY